MPRSLTLTKLQADYASLTYRKPGSPEAEEASRKFWCARLIENVEEVLAKSPPFTQAQRDEIIAVLCAGDLAPESTPAP
jgi:hypothetical protein